MRVGVPDDQGGPISWGGGQAGATTSRHTTQRWIPATARPTGKQTKKREKRCQLSQSTPIPNNLDQILCQVEIFNFLIMFCNCDVFLVYERKFCTFLTGL